MIKLKLPRLAYNSVSAFGAAIAIISGVTGAVLLVAGMFEQDTNPYFGIFLYTVIPAIFVFGMVLVPLGMFRQYRRILKGIAQEQMVWPRIDLNQKTHRNAAITLVLSIGFFIVISAVGSYRAYHFSESVEFCGTTCHVVMKPEYTAYQNSPHARVACAACHIGSGAGWFAKSKMSGMYQVYAVLADKYPRPIPTPVKNLRPAQETCEQCHWPEKFWGGQQKQFVHYMYDSANTYWPINMLIKTGGGDPETGKSSGIHWHMNIGVKVEYIARDYERTDIPWVKITDRTTGRVTIYQNSESPLSDSEKVALEPSVMDCMDCHNRPSHVYNAPDHAIDEAILVGRIPRSLPDVKKAAVEAMAAEYETEEAALIGIANMMTAYYQTNWPQVYVDRRVDIDKSIKETQRVFSQNIFPEMKVKWSEYPSNLGHFTSIGCMRCHSPNMVTDAGLALTTDCNTCHTIMSQGSGDRAQVATTQNGLDFVHPEEIDDAWKEMGCWECHTGVQP
jgi:NapC/NirT cytochrome c family, N-terminal region